MGAWPRTRGDERREAVRAGQNLGAEGVRGRGPEDPQLRVPSRSVGAGMGGAPRPPGAALWAGDDSRDDKPRLDLRLHEGPRVQHRRRGVSDVGVQSPDPKQGGRGV